MKQIFFPFVLVLLMASCGGKTTAPATTDETAEADSTDTSAIDTTGIDATTSATSKPNEVLFNGTLTEPPQRHATVALTMDGIVRTTSLLPGKYVARGSVVATIQNPEFITLQQDYLQSHAQIEYLKAEYDRQKALSEGEAASQKKYQESKAGYLAMKTKLESSATQLQLLGISPASLLKSGIRPLLLVRAPISGYVSTVGVNVGKYVHSGDALCEIIDKSQMLLCLTTYEKDITKMRVGKSIEFHVNGFPGQTFRASIISIGQSIDRVNRATEVYARMTTTNPQFRPGMYVSARMLK